MVKSRRCLADIDTDHDVDGADLALLADDYDRTDCSEASPCVGDVNGDGVVNTDDLGILASEFGRTLCPEDKFYYFHNDHLSTPQRVTDQNGTIVWSANYVPFGEATVTHNTISNPFRFPGQYFDNETGLHYNYFRYYEPGVGRYLRPDPLFFKKLSDKYQFAHNNPITSYDSKGLIAATMTESLTLAIETTGVTPLVVHPSLGLAVFIVLSTPSETAGPELDMQTPPYDSNQLIASIEVQTGPREMPDLSYTPESCRLRFEACRRAAKIKYPCQARKRNWEIVKCWIGFIMCLISNL